MLPRGLLILYSVVLIFIGFSVSNALMIQHDLKTVESLQRKMNKTVDNQNKLVENVNVALENINKILEVKEKK